jgi:hypothetical protein
VSNAKYCGLTTSEYLRRCALNKKIVPRTDTETIASLMKLGGSQLKSIAELRAANPVNNNPAVIQIIADLNALYRDIHNAIRSIRSIAEGGQNDNQRNQP